MWPAVLIATQKSAGCSWRGNGDPEPRKKYQISDLWALSYRLVCGSPITYNRRTGATSKMGRYVASEYFRTTPFVLDIRDLIMDIASIPNNWTCLSSEEDELCKIMMFFSHAFCLLERGHFYSYENRLIGCYSRFIILGLSFMLLIAFFKVA